MSSSCEWIVHIGIQKTGTKALQSFVMRQPALMQQLGLYHPDTGRDGAVWHLGLYQALMAGPSEALLARLVQEAQASGLPRALISYEGLSLLSDEALAALRHGLGARIRVVLVMRRQDDWLSSWYNQLIKAHRVNIHRIEAFERVLLDYNEECDYARTFQRWARHVGSEAITPLIYERGVSIVPRFFDALGLPLPQQAPSQPAMTNPALSARGMAVLREIKRLVGTDARLPEVVEAFHRRRRDCFVNTHAEGSLSVLAPGERQAFLARYEASNEWMRAHCFPQRERLFDAEPPASHAVVQSDDTTRQEALALLEQLGWRPEPQPKG